MGSHVIVVGAEPLTQVIVEALLERGADVVVMAEAHARPDVVRTLHRCGARCVDGSPLVAADLADAGIERASVLVLTGEDDAGNADAVLLARRLRADLPVIARIFDPALSAYLQNTVPNLTVLSMSAIAAPAIVEVALKTLARERPGGGPVARRRVAHHRLRLDRVLVAAMVLAVVLVVVSSLYFSYALNLKPLDALYFVWTTIFTVGYGDISLKDAGDAAKIAGMLVMFCGASLLAIMYAMLTGWVIAQRVDVLRGRVPVRRREHIVVAGAGNVGYRVALMLGQRGWPVVVLERQEGRRISDLRSAGEQVILGDALAEESLALANVEGCAAALVLTDSDGTNLELALRMRALNPGLPIVVRLSSRELSAHVERRADAIPVSPLLLAGRAFVDAIVAAQMREPERYEEREQT